MAAKKLIIVGVDGLSTTLLRLLRREAETRSLSELLESISFRLLRSVVPPLTPPAWASFATGVPPEVHKIYAWKSRSVVDGDFKLADSTDIKLPTIWEVLTQAGLSVGVYCQPLSYPPYPVNGWIVSGMGVPSDADDFALPESLRRTIRERFPELRMRARASARRPGLSARALARHARTASDALQLSGRVFRFLHGEYPVDCGFVQLQDSDFLQHYTWPVLSAMASGKEPTGASAVEDAISALFDVMLDLRELAKRSGSALLYVSDHGFGPSSPVRRCPNRYLKDLGYLEVRSRAIAERRPWSKVAGKALLYKRLGLKKGILRVLKTLRWRGHRLARRIAGAFLPDDSTVARKAADIDWEKTIAYYVGGERDGVVNVNLKGREPFGAVTPERYVEVLQDVARDLAGLKNEEGEPMYRSVERINCQGSPPALDLLLRSRNREWNHHGLAEFEGFLFGGHDPNGILLAENLPLEDGWKAKLTDVAPTVLDFFDIEKPDYMWGKSLLKENDRPKRKIDLEGFSRTARTAEISEEEAERMSKHLADLGYV